MRRLQLRRLLSSSALAGLAVLGGLSGCADAPTAPVAVVETPVAPPNEVVATSGTLVQLGALSGFANGGVYAVNTAGVTAGWNNTTGGAYHAFLRATDGTMTDLGTLGGNGSVGLAINNSNAVAGLAYLTGNTTYHAFLSSVVNGTRTMRDLGALTATAKSAAYGINTGGTVVGFSYNAAGQQRAVRWVAPNYVIQDLGTLGGTSGFAYDVNTNGVIVGFSTTAAGQTRGFRWNGGTMTNLGGLPGGTSSVAHGINAGGDIVGWATTASGETHAWGVYAAASSTYDLGTAGRPSYAYDINDVQQAVGWGLDATGANAALLWDASPVSKDLGTLGTTTSGQAYAINGNGQVVGLSGNSATMWFINTNRVPTANAGTYAATKKNVVVTLNGSASSDPDGDLLTYAWDFGDGTTGTGVHPTHSWTTGLILSTTYTIKLTVTDWRGGKSAQVQTTIKITP